MEKIKPIFLVNDRGTERLIRAYSRKAAMAFVCNEIDSDKAGANDVARLMAQGVKIEEAE